MVNIKKYYPHIYDGFLEIDVLSDIQNKQFTNLEEEINSFIMNQFIQTCNIEKIEEIERILKIPINNDDIDFRRKRILNRLSMSAPYTMPFLRSRLDSIIGKDKYTINMDYSNYTLYIESSAINQEWFHETYITIHRIKPCNIVFINKPLITTDIKVNEKIEFSKRVYNYRLGYWNLGRKPFSSLDDSEVLKLEEVKSIDNNLIANLKQHIADKISYVKLNDSYKISQFITKSIVGDKVVVEYRVDKNNSISEVNKITLYDADDNILSNVNVYAPIGDGIELKHLFDVKEVS